MGGEYIALKNLFRANGITHLQIPPHTPQHNEIAEHQHRHLVEIRLTLLPSTSLPPKFWSYTFQIATYLINR